MSETVSTATTSAPSGGQTSAPQTGTGNQATSGGAPSQAQGQTNTGEAQGQTAQERLLAEQDLDAFIEQTINGQKQKVKVRDLMKSYGLEKTANQRLQEAAAERKRVQQLQHLMQTDFAKYCEITGQDPNQFLRQQLQSREDIAEEILAKKYELSQMDPHQREALEAKQRSESLEAELKAIKQPIIDEIKKLVPEKYLPKGLEQAKPDQLRAYLETKQQEFQAGLDQTSNELLEAWQKVGLPKEKDFGAWMAQVMLDHDRRAKAHFERTGEEIPSLQPEQAAVKVKQRFLNSTRSLLSNMDAKAIHEVLGEAIIQKLRDHDSQLASQATGPNFGNQTPPSEQAPSDQKKYLSQAEWRKAMGVQF